MSLRSNEVLTNRFGHYGLQMYLNIFKLLGVKLVPGFIFLSLTKSNKARPLFIESATSHSQAYTLLYWVTV